MLRLIRPSINYQDSFVEALQENPAEPLPPLLNQLRFRQKLSTKLFLPWLNTHFSQFLLYTRQPSRLLRDFPNLPHQYQYWLVDNVHFLGRATIRPYLTDALRRQGGNLGVWIRPNYRRQGYGTLLLKKAVDKARRLGLTKVLLTCQTHNHSSQKLIHKLSVRKPKLSRWSTPSRDRYWLILS